MLGPSVGDQVLHPGKELVGIERLVGVERDRLHVLVVVVLQPAVIVVVMMAVAVIVVVIVVMLVGLQELRLDVEDAVEVEGVAAEHLARARSASAGCGAAWHRG